MNNLPDNVTEVFNDGQQAYYRVKMDYSNTFKDSSMLDQIKQLHEENNQNINYFVNKKQTLLDRINLYLQHGGFFNPEHMDHDQVRKLLLDIKDYLESKEEYNAGYNDGYEEGIDLD